MESKFLGSTGLAKFLENLYNVFSMVGHTHTKSQITDFPTIPSNVSQLTNDSGYITAGQVTTIMPVDSSLSETSENPVQNKTIKAEFDNVRDLIGKDTVQNQIDNAIKSMVIEVDGTLSIDGAPADAKVVGDTINNINSYIFNIDYDNLLAFDTYEIIFDTNIDDTTPILGEAILGQMILA